MHACRHNDKYFMTFNHKICFDAYAPQSFWLFCTSVNTSEWFRLNFWSMLNCSSNWPRDVYGEKLVIICIAKIIKMDQIASCKWCAGRWPSMYVMLQNLFWAKNMIHWLSTQWSDEKLWYCVNVVVLMLRNCLGIALWLCFAVVTNYLFNILFKMVGKK